MRFLRRLGLLVALCALFIPLTIHAQDAADVDAAKAVLDKLVSGDYAGLYAQFDDQVKAAVTQAQIQQVWDEIVQQNGAFQKISDIEAGPTAHTVILTLQFEKSPLNFGLAFDADGKIGGLRFFPAAASTEALQIAPTPTYADPSDFTEMPVTVGDLKLRGTITMPKGDGPFPAVVLISGSGGNDQDETIGPNKPFRDLAWGLAAQGIATIRFDKRTYQPKAKIDLTTFTIKDEYIDDSVAAVNLISSTAGIDPKRVFILGHSLGGYVLPRIAQAAPNVAGMIIASGSVEPLQDAIVRQTQYVLSLSESTPEANATEDPQLAQVEAMRQQINAITPSTPKTTVVFGAGPAYWLDLQNYNPVTLAASLPQPILVLQGERDYQVTMTDDFAKWQAGLADHKDTTFKTFPGLNHIYETGPEPPSPADYNNPGNVAPEVIDAIATWVKAH
ncbi:MAG TPA: alpha/beta fold hydrolase [Phototrophicaceae bacterium]|nr:alpha/beta fold hydrolase [Phototrophicaceae bacterium]